MESFSKSAVGRNPQSPRFQIRANQSCVEGLGSSALHLEAANAILLVSQKRAQRPHISQTCTLAWSAQIETLLSLPQY